MITCHARELDYLQRDLLALESYGAVPAIEGIGYLSRLFDVFGRILHNVQTSILGSFSDFKRSELRAFEESRARAAAQLLRHPPAGWLELLLPIPDGLKTPYLPVVTGLNELDHRLALTNSLAQVELVLKLLIKQPVERWADQLGVIKDTTVAINRLDQPSLQAALRSYFEDSVTGVERKAGVLLGSTEQLNQVHRLIIGFEQSYRACMQAWKQSKGFNHTIDQLVHQLAARQDLDAQLMQALYDFVRTTATQLDHQAVIAHEMQRVEHNYTLGLARLLQAAG